MAKLRHAVTRLMLGIFMLLSATVAAHGGKPAINLPAVAEVLSGYNNVDSVKQRLLESGMHDIEGIWQYPDDGARIAIERMPLDPTRDVTRYRMVILWSPRRSIAPGTTMGIVSPTAKKGVFKALIYTSTLGARHLTAPRSYTLKLTDSGHFTVTPDRNLKFRANLWRLIPYLSNTLALRVQTQDNTPNDLDGCIRLFPTPATGINGPRYL